MDKNEKNLKSYNANIWKSYIYKFLRSAHFFGGVLIPFFTLWGGITFAQVMILQAVFTFSMFVFEIPTGTIADRFGRKTSLALAGIISGVGALIYGSFPSFWIFVIGEVLFAIGATLVSGADQALLYDSLKQIKKEKESKRIFGRFDSTGLMAIAIAAPIGSLIAKSLGLQYAMILTAVPLLIATGIALTFKEPKILTNKQAKNKSYIKILKKGLKYFKEHKALKILAFEYIFITMLTFFLVWVYQVVLQSINVDLKWFGFVHAAMVVVEIIILNNFLRLEKFLGGKKRYLVISSLLCGFGFLSLAIFQNIYLVLASILLIAGFGLTRKPLFHNYMNKFIESETRATVLSSISMVYSFTIAIGNILLGYLVDWNLNYSLGIIGLLIIFFVIISQIKEEHLLD